MRIGIKAHVLLLLVLVGCAAPAATPSLTQIPRGDKPNIILLLVDDMDMSLLAYMPNLKRLVGEQGATFNNFFVGGPTCCPSRASALRGQYPHNTGIFANSGPAGGFATFQERDLDGSTIATWLQEAGYHTILIGKYLNGYPFEDDKTYVPPGWSDWYGLLTERASNTPESDENGEADDEATPLPPGSTAVTPALSYGGHYFDYTLNQNGQLVDYGPGPDAYQTDVFAKLAVERIQAASAAERPFFLYLTPFAPHLPARAAPRHEALFQDVALPQPPSFNEADVSDKGAPYQQFPLLRRKQIERLEKLYRRRIQSMQAVDEMLAQLVETLERSGELERTYIFFSSDNGLHIGQHRFSPSKFTPYEEDIHVPLLVRGPGIAAGLEIDELGLNNDLAPTFAELGGVTPPDFVDGRSLLPLLGLRPVPSAPWRKSLLVEYWVSADDRARFMEGEQMPFVARKEGAPLPPISTIQYQALRTGGYLYVEHSSGDVELYDLKADPYQLESLASTADPALLQQLAGRLRALASCAGGACQALEREGD